jgi:hypothetical protein
MEDVGVGGVVDDDALGEVSVEERQVLHIGAIVIHTIFTEQAFGDQLWRTRERVVRDGRGDQQGTLSGSSVSRSGSAYLFKEAV